MGSGGAERVISNLLPKLMLDYEVNLFLVFNVFHYELPENLKVTVVSASNKLSHLQKFSLIPKIFYHYINFVKKNKIDISMSFLTVPNLLNGLLSFFNKDVKIIISERNYPSILYRSSELKFYTYKVLIPLFYSRADVVFSNSEWINLDLRENFKVKTKMEVVYNPIVLPEVTKTPANFSDGLLKFVNVGRIFATKNQKMIINALATVDPSAYHLTFLGDGIMKAQLMEMVQSLNLTENIQFNGNVKDVNAHLLNQDCFILSSNSEGFPNALLEAMAIGLPVISTNCKSGPLELLNENEQVNIPIGGFVEVKYGILVNINDPKGLSDAIIFLLNNRNLLRIYSEKSIQRAADFELDVIYDRLKKLILD